MHVPVASRHHAGVGQVEEWVAKGMLGVRSRLNWRWAGDGSWWQQCTSGSYLPFPTQPYSLLENMPAEWKQEPEQLLRETALLATVPTRWMILTAGICSQ